MEITALKNSQVKMACALKQKKYREKERKFLAEGLRTVEEAVKSGAVVSVFYTDAENARLEACLGKAATCGAKLYRVSEGVFKKIADTETPQGIVAVCRIPEYSLEDLFGSSRLLLALDRIADPGNLGTILRTADAAGAAGVALFAGCTDLYAPKTVRASMGSVFHIPAIAGVTEEEFFKAAHKWGYKVVVTCLRGAENLYTAELAGRLVLVMGSESTGVSENILKTADTKLYIPMPGAAESLNVAVATGIFMFELLRRNLNA